MENSAPEFSYLQFNPSVRSQNSPLRGHKSVSNGQLDKGQCQLIIFMVALRFLSFPWDYKDEDDFCKL